MCLKLCVFSANFKIMVSLVLYQIMHKFEGHDYDAFNLFVTTKKIMASYRMLRLIAQKFWGMPQAFACQEKHMADIYK